MVEVRLQAVLFGIRKKGQILVENDETLSNLLKDPFFVPHFLG